MVSAGRVPTTTIESPSPGIIKRRHDDPIRSYRDLVELIAFRRSPPADDTAERAVVAVPALVEMIDIQLDAYLAAVAAGLNLERSKNEKLEADLESSVQRIRALEADLASLRHNARSRIKGLESEIATLRSNVRS